MARMTTTMVTRSMLRAASGWWWTKLECVAISECSRISRPMASSIGAVKSRSTHSSERTSVMTALPVPRLEITLPCVVPRNSLYEMAPAPVSSAR